MYLLSFLKRLKLKSAIYFSILPAALVSIIFFDSFWFTFHNLALFAVTLYGAGFLLNERDKRRITNVHCRICGFTNCSLLYPARKKSAQISEKGSFACSSFDHGSYPDIYLCPHCKNGFLKNIGTEGFEDFAQDGLEKYKEVEDTEYISNIDARYITNRKIIEKHSELFKNKNVLEVGAYYGAFAHEAIPVTDSYVALEPSQHACSYLKEKFPKAEVHNVGIDDLNSIDSLKDRKFDTIVMLDVIEHLPDPISALKVLHSYLEKDGTIFFSTINIESTFSIALGPWWPWFMDMHYYYFSDRGLEDTLHRTGFILNAHQHFPYYVYCSYFVKKVLGIVTGRRTISQKLERGLRFPILIKLGDTVLITGKKV